MKHKHHDFYTQDLERLNLVREHLEDGATTRELAEKIGYRESSVSSFMTGLAHASWVKRKGRKWYLTKNAPKE